MERNYEEISDTLSNFGIKCSLPYYISTGKHITDFPEKPFRINFYCLCICFEGDIDVKIDNHTYRISKNDILAASPSSIMQFIKTSPDFRMKLVFFDKNFLLRDFADPFILDRMDLFSRSNYTVLQGTGKDAKKWLNLINYLENKSRETGRYKHEIIRTILYNILLETLEIWYNSEIKDKVQEGKPDNIYVRFLKSVQQNIKKHTDIQFYAQTLCITDKHLIKTVKKNSGKTPMQIITENLFKEAIVLLNNQALNISDIAYQLNFSSGSTFSRFFKKQSGISPQNYRKNR